MENLWYSNRKQFVKFRKDMIRRKTADCPDLCRRRLPAAGAADMWLQAGARIYLNRLQGEQPVCSRENVRGK